MLYEKNNNHWIAPFKDAWNLIKVCSEIEND